MTRGQKSSMCSTSKSVSVFACKCLMYVYIKQISTRLSKNTRHKYHSPYFWYIDRAWTTELYCCLEVVRWRCHIQTFLDDHVYIAYFLPSAPPCQLSSMTLWFGRSLLIICSECMMRCVSKIFHPPILKCLFATFQRFFFGCSGEAIYEI